MSRIEPVSVAVGVGCRWARCCCTCCPRCSLFALFAGVGIIHVTSRVLVVDMGYRLSKAEAEERALIRENDRLKLELATLKNPARLEKLAREQLGMAMPSGPRRHRPAGGAAGQEAQRPRGGPRCARRARGRARRTKH